GTSAVIRSVLVRTNGNAYTMVHERECVYYGQRRQDYEITHGSGEQQWKRVYGRGQKPNPSRHQIRYRNHLLKQSQRSRCCLRMTMRWFARAHAGYWRQSPIFGSSLRPTMAMRLYEKPSVPIPTWR